jgi:hypothetical protein
MAARQAMKVFASIRIIGGASPKFETTAYKHKAPLGLKPKILTQYHLVH